MAYVREKRNLFGRDKGAGNIVSALGRRAEEEYIVKTFIMCTLY